MNIKKMKLTDLKRASYNPRLELKSGDREYEKLKRSIEEFGYVEPIIVNKKTGNIVGGHQRLTVLEDLGIKDVDCVVIDVSETQEKQLNLALNKISGDWDMPALKDLLQDLDTGDIDMDLTGFDDWEIENLMTQHHIDYDKLDEFFDENEAEPKPPKMIKCPHCGEEFEK